MCKLMRISVITICYNAESSIKKTIESVIQQEYYDMEYILVDGESSDRTNEIIESMRYEFEDRGIFFNHISEQDLGISDAFNKGIKIAKGDIICILNSGDRLCLGSLKRVDSEFSSEIDILYGNIIWNDCKNLLQYIRKSDKTTRMLPLRMACFHPATFIKKRAYKKVGNYRVDFKISMDRELLCRMKKKGMRFKYVDFEFAIVEAGGVSDQKEKAKRRLEEGKIIAHDNGIPGIIYLIYSRYRQILLDFKNFLKKRTNIYNIISIQNDNIE